MGISSAGKFAQGAGSPFYSVSPFGATDTTAGCMDILVNGERANKQPHLFSFIWKMLTSANRMLLCIPGTINSLREEIKCTALINP